MRASDLHDLRRVLAGLCTAEPGTDPRARAVIVPSRGAATVLRETLAGRCGIAPDQIPLLLTRDGLYDSLHERLQTCPRRLTTFERDAIAQAAAEAAAAAVGTLPFRIRPGLVAEILRFYDQLRRQSQRTIRFEELITEALGSADTDRGTERLHLQTRFLARTFHEYERRVEDSGACDEHGLRDRALTSTLTTPVRHVIVTMSDWIADPSGLFVADFDLLTRLDSLERLDIVSTAAVLGSGFHERIHTWWPGLEEVDATSIAPIASPVRPMLVRPDTEGEPLWFTHRDREEELIAVARRLGSSGRPELESLNRAAIVFKKPLPYLYLARRTLAASGIPFRSVDALPLAAEPIVSSIALILDAVTTTFARTALVELLRSPHLRILDDGQEVSRESVSLLNHALSDARYLGDLERLEALSLSRPADDLAASAFRAAVKVVRDLSVLRESAPASRHLKGLLHALEQYLRPIDVADPLGARDQQGRDVMLRILRTMMEAHHAHHDPSWTAEDLSAAVHRWIGDETLAAETAENGIYLIDDQAARYGAFDDVTIVGLIENEWPERSRRNVFYPPRLLKALGWPSESDRQAASDAQFLDLLASSSGRVELSTMTLDDEALVTRSIQLDEVPRASLSSMTRALAGPALPSSESESPGASDAAAREPIEWRAIRNSRAPGDSPQFHGTIGSRDTTRPWSVSALETFMGCPFKFFAQHVLRLAEEPDDEEVMDPRRQGQLVHSVFESFFAEWQRAGQREITAANLADARDRFTDVVERTLAPLAVGEAGLERTRLLGSPAAAGLGEAVFRMEAERGVPVVERLLEHSLSGRFRIETADGTRDVDLRGKADRIDLLADGTFRLIDYKLGWPPDKSRALQLPIYGLCAEQQLAGRHGRRWALGEALYLAFKGPRRVVPLFTPQQDRNVVLKRAQQRLVDALDAIARGDFPPTPDDVYRCETCSFASVCRKDYVGNV